MRRIALLLCAVAACLLAAARGGAAPRATDFELPLGTAGPTARAAAADAPGRRRVHPARRARSRSSGCAGARAGADVHAQIRVRDAARLAPLDRGRRTRTARAGRDPAWAGRATAVQLRLCAPRARAEAPLRLGARPRCRGSRPVARAAASQPAIIPRSQWGGDTECAPRDAPSMGGVQMAFVHHTVSANEYGPGDSAAMVLGICRFHRNSNGWDDIGYNFLVDKYGQVFEGRAGGRRPAGRRRAGAGLERAVDRHREPRHVLRRAADRRGAERDGEPHRVEAAAARRAGDRHGRRCSRPAAASNRYPSGTMHTFERISGHRDGNETECPGAPAVRPAAAAALDGRRARAGGHRRAAAATVGRGVEALARREPARVLVPRAGAADRPAGRPRGGPAIGGQRVRIQVLTAQGFRAVASAATGADGAYTAELPTSRNRVVRALVGKVASNRVTLKVAPALAGHRAGQAREGRAAVGHQGLAAAEEGPGRRDRLPRGRAAGTGGRSRVRVRAARDGRFRAAVPLARPGLYRLRLRFAGDKRNAPAQADYFVRAVRKLSAVAPAVPAAR